MLPENEEAVNVYNIAGGQILTAGMGDVIGLSIPAVKIVMDLCDVVDQLLCLKKVMIIFSEVQKLMKDETGKVSRMAKIYGIIPPGVTNGDEN